MMTILGLKRLKVLRKVLRDASRNPYFNTIFTMKQYGYESPYTHDPALEENIHLNTCGTPACAMGHYAARRDLQRSFWLDPDGEMKLAGRGGSIKNNDSFEESCGDDYAKHFSITERQADMLFGGEGCGNAETPKEAADYISSFIKSESKYVNQKTV
jgi:hypothetical protein